MPLKMESIPTTSAPDSNPDINQMLSSMKKKLGNWNKRISPKVSLPPSLSISSAATTQTPFLSSSARVATGISCDASLLKPLHSVQASRSCSSSTATDDDTLRFPSSGLSSSPTIFSDASADKMDSNSSESSNDMDTLSKPSKADPGRDTPFITPVLHTWYPSPKTVPISNLVGPIKLNRTLHSPLTKRKRLTSYKNPSIHSTSSLSYNADISSSSTPFSKRRRRSSPAPQQKLSVSFSDVPEQFDSRQNKSFSHTSTLSLPNNSISPASSILPDPSSQIVKRGILKSPSESFPFDNEPFYDGNNYISSRALVGRKTSFGNVRVNIKKPKELSKEERERLEKLHKIAFSETPSFKTSSAAVEGNQDTDNDDENDKNTRTRLETNTATVKSSTAMDDKQKNVPGINLSEIAKSLKTFFGESKSIKKPLLDSTKSSTNPLSVSSKPTSTIKSFSPVTFEASSNSPPDPEANSDLSDARVALAQMLQASRLRPGKSAPTEPSVSPSADPPRPSTSADSSFNPNNSMSSDFSFSFSNYSDTADRVLNKTRWEQAADAVLRSRTSRNKIGTSQTGSNLPDTSFSHSLNNINSRGESGDTNERKRRSVKVMSLLPSSSVFANAIEKAAGNESIKPFSHKLENTETNPIQLAQHNKRIPLSAVNKNIVPTISFIDDSDKHKSFINGIGNGDKHRNKANMSNSFSNYQKVKKLGPEKISHPIARQRILHSDSFTKRKVARRTFHITGNSSREFSNAATKSKSLLVRTNSLDNNSRVFEQVSGQFCFQENLQLTDMVFPSNDSTFSTEQELSPTSQLYKYTGDDGARKEGSLKSIHESRRDFSSSSKLSLSRKVSESLKIKSGAKNSVSIASLETDEDTDLVLEQSDCSSFSDAPLSNSELDHSDDLSLYSNTHSKAKNLKGTNSSGSNSSRSNTSDLEANTSKENVQDRDAECITNLLLLREAHWK